MSPAFTDQILRVASIRVVVLMAAGSMRNKSATPGNLIAARDEAMDS